MFIDEVLNKASKHYQASRRYTYDRRSSVSIRCDHHTGDNRNTARIDGHFFGGGNFLPLIINRLIVRLSMSVRFSIAITFVAQFHEETSQPRCRNSTVEILEAASVRQAQEMCSLSRGCWLTCDKQRRRQQDAVTTKNRKLSIRFKNINLSRSTVIHIPQRT